MSKEEIVTDISEILGLKDPDNEVQRIEPLPDAGKVFFDEDVTNGEVMMAEDGETVVNFAKDAINDYQRARKLHQHLINRGTIALDGMLEIARTSNQLRTYEVVSTLIGTVSASTKELISLQKNMAGIISLLGNASGDGGGDKSTKKTPLSVKDLMSLVEEMRKSPKDSNTDGK